MEMGAQDLSTIWAKVSTCFSITSTFHKKKKSPTYILSFRKKAFLLPRASSAAKQPSLVSLCQTLSHAGLSWQTVLLKREVRTKGKWMFLLKPLMCNTSLLRVRKEKTAKATHQGSKLMKDEGGPQPCSHKELHDKCPEDACLDPGPSIVGIHWVLAAWIWNVPKNILSNLSVLK